MTIKERRKPYTAEAPEKEEELPFELPASDKDWPLWAKNVHSCRLISGEHIVGIAVERKEGRYTIFMDPVQCGLRPDPRTAGTTNVYGMVGAVPYPLTGTISNCVEIKEDRVLYWMPPPMEAFVRLYGQAIGRMRTPPPEEKAVKFPKPQSGGTKPKKRKGKKRR